MVRLVSVFSAPTRAALFLRWGGLWWLLKPAPQQFPNDITDCGVFLCRLDLHGDMEFLRDTNCELDFHLAPFVYAMPYNYYTRF